MSYSLLVAFSILLSLKIFIAYQKISQNSLSEKIKLNKNFYNDDGKFERLKYEKFLLENKTRFFQS